MSAIFLFIGGSEVFFLVLIVVMLFGSKKIPEIARGLGKGMRELKDASNEIKREIKSSSEVIDKEVDQIKKDITK
jgi:sec-independent protein translocase protein TatA